MKCGIISEKIYIIASINKEAVKLNGHTRGINVKRVTETAKRLYDIQTAALAICCMCSVVLSVLSMAGNWAKIGAVGLFIITCAAYGNRKSVRASDYWTTENAVMYSVVSVALYGYLFSGFFILGRNFIGLFR